MSGLYVHIPWCVRKCPYCDFNSHALNRALPESDYVDALLADFARERERMPFDIASVYFGGGTPSLLPARGFARLLDAFELSDGVEVTMEANPGTVETAGAMKDYAAAGIGRISLGAQSFHDGNLKRLGRIHTAEETRRAAAAITRAGFDEFNIDLMFGLPEQTAAAAIADLECAIALEPTHISWYELTIEPNTAFAIHPPPLPALDEKADISEAGQAVLESHGFGRYEVSAYAQPGSEARHNMNYWTFGDYSGIGAGAHGKLTLPTGIVRTNKAKQPGRYLEDQSPEDTPVEAKDLPLEYMMNALRLVRGTDEAAYPERTGLPIETISGEIARLRAEGLMRQDRIGLTDFGFSHLDTVVARFF